MSRLQFSLCGSYGRDDELDPYLVCAPPVRQEVLGLINLNPLTTDEIAARLGLPQEEVTKHLGALEKAGLVEQTSHRYKPNFAVFTVQDQQRLEPLLAEMAGLFREAVRDNMDIIRSAYAASGFSKHGFSFADLAYVLVGAYILDYGGLALRDAGLLIASKEMPGGSYVFTGFEGDLRNLRASWMWGHAFAFGPFTFFSHGELPTEGGRLCFPDKAWRWWGEGRSEQEVTRTMEELGRILVALYDAPTKLDKLVGRTGLEPGKLAEHLGLLTELEYVEEKDIWCSLCPVVDDTAEAQIRRMVQEIWAGLLALAVRPYWGALSHLYWETAPARNGIDLREAFNPIHHVIFEQALRLLMERDDIPWPKCHADGARYAVWIEHKKDGQ
ncbi:winged helix-turn-helix domain-containing protein [Candidatus Acetothermia bacterium]|nr:winged helix-turn-helix domain-containing protein [Candidatus Acetothermia bacterium]